ncbi:MAG: biopolymer transporter ExbD [Candidatus Tectomicrobia bacterium]|nr:biopolymer transporter ExbD [Candidatus Tectomicrobia bacterium]
MQFRARQPTSPSVNVISLIDVVLMLLIFFMLSTTFVAQPGITVNLPKAESQASTGSQDIIVAVTAGGDLYVNEQRVTLETLAEHLRRLLAEKPASVVIVKADETIRHGLVVTIMDVAKQRGAQRLAIATRPRDTAP